MAASPEHTLTATAAPIAGEVVHAEHVAIDLRLALLGMTPPADEDASLSLLVQPLLARQREVSRRLSDRLCAVDLRIQAFLDTYLEGTDTPVGLPRRTLVLDQPGLARVLSLPKHGDTFSSDLLSSYRLRNGVLHNPANDRRTTAGVFHIAEGGLPIPDDKIAVPRAVFGRLLDKALQPPTSALQLPYLSDEAEPAGCFVSLLLRPLVVPAVPGYLREKRMEIRFIVPGGLVSNLDFVESIFGNAGDPYLADNDAGLDPEGWTGHTGLVILAPHLTALTKKELGLPHVDEASARQRRDGMCWASEDERYNGGQAFKVCARDANGVIVTVIADNYYGYCKKEVKTQISYSANLFGTAEEEHSGGAMTFASHNQGQEFTNTSTRSGYTFAEAIALGAGRLALQPEGHAIDVNNPHNVIVPVPTAFSLRSKTVSWDGADGTRVSIPMRAGHYYLAPDGYRVHMARIVADGNQWSLIGTYADPVTCHKPSTVSGGGKSEISKAITDAVIHGNAYTADFDADMESVAAILARDYSQRHTDPTWNRDQRPLLSDTRSVGSVIKLLTPSPVYAPEYNEWLESIPPHVKELVFVVKRFYRPEWGQNWRDHFTVGIINGRKGNALRLDGDKINVDTLRVGFAPDGSWRIFGLRHDFAPAAKVQTEDDITASIVTPPGVADGSALSRKVVGNCEVRLFQRPDDAIHRGYDSQAEKDIATPGTFLSNFEPLDRAAAQDLVDDEIGLDAFTAPMRDLIVDAAGSTDGPDYLVSSAHPRMVDGKPSKNPRYLQLRPDISDPLSFATADLAMHLSRRTPLTESLAVSVDVVAAGRRNNPPEAGVPPLCSYNPLHFMELPELFMEFISSMTGKSPSTTGAGSEGALTKGPFNAMPAILDLNAAFLSYALTGYDGWLSSAGYVGPSVRVEHDISLLVPEVFARMTSQERSASALIENGCLERVTDIEHDGRRVESARLGYRMTAKFASTYFGRIFLHPHVVFTPEMLRPELQDADVFAESVDIIVETHRRVAQAYIDDGTIAWACPPLRGLLEIMARGTTTDGLTLDSPKFRSQFSREAVLGSDWYAERLTAKQSEDVRRWRSGVAGLEHFVVKPNNAEAVERLGLDARLDHARKALGRVESPQYRSDLIGTLGRSPAL